MVGYESVKSPLRWRKTVFLITKGHQKDPFYNIWLLWGIFCSPPSIRHSGDSEHLYSSVGTHAYIWSVGRASHPADRDEARLRHDGANSGHREHAQRPRPRRLRLSQTPGRCSSHRWIRKQSSLPRQGEPQSSRINRANIGFSRPEATDLYPRGHAIYWVKLLPTTFRVTRFFKPSNPKCNTGRVTLIKMGFN